MVMPDTARRYTIEEVLAEARRDPAGSLGPRGSLGMAVTR